ncbi:MAG: class I SAM-dependent methyltransferase [Hominimerdicola sp.]
MDKRLLTCAMLCTGDCVADIGTDHAYLPCYMIKEGLCRTALACDVAEKPLESARQHVLSQGLDDKIKIILSDGLDNVPSDGVTDIVMAGMGGELISRLLEKCSWIKNADINLVLQPMTKWDCLRQWLYDNNFEVTKELACTEGQFVYSVMQVKYIGKKPPYNCDGKYLHFGFVTDDYPEGREYISKQCSRLETAGKGMLNSPEKSAYGKQLITLAEEYRK